MILDIAVPRDVDPEVGTLPGIHLIDIDALRDLVEDRLERRRAAIPLVEHLLVSHVERFAQWYKMLPATQHIALVAQRAEQLRLDEIENVVCALSFP